MEKQQDSDRRSTPIYKMRSPFNFSKNLFFLSHQSRYTGQRKISYSQPKWDVNRQKMKSFNFPKLN
jgi:hypothetical protein